MARASQKDILSRVQDLGEEALQKLSEVPGGSRLVDMANQTKSRLDDLQKRVRGLEGLEQRVAELERQLAAQSSTTQSSSATSKSAVQPKRTAQAKDAAQTEEGTSSPTSKTPSAEKPSAPKKPPA